MIFNRQRVRDKAALRRIHDSAVHQALAPGQPRVGLTGTASQISTIAANETRVGPNFETIEPFLYGVDNPRTDPVYLVVGYPTRTYGILKKI